MLTACRAPTLRFRFAGTTAGHSWMIADVARATRILRTFVAIKAEYLGMASPRE
jgi:hypothetical protein